MSKLNPQNATAYVGPGVLRKGGKITPVPNGPLIKKKGPFKGSTLKTGGTIKKAQNGDTTKVATLSPYMQKRAAQKVKNAARLAPIETAQQKRYENWKNSSKDNSNKSYEDWQKGLVKAQKAKDVPRYEISTAKDARELARESNRASGPGFFDVIGQIFTEKPGCIFTDEDKSGVKKRNGGPVKKAKAGAMIKRADGSMSKRGLWDNIRANKGSGKKPTKQMLVQEKKIKAKSKK